MKSEPSENIPTQQQPENHRLQKNKKAGYTEMVIHNAAGHKILPTLTQITHTHTQIILSRNLRKKFVFFKAVEEILNFNEKMCIIKRRSREV